MQRRRQGHATTHDSWNVVAEERCMAWTAGPGRAGPAPKAPAVSCRLPPPISTAWVRVMSFLWHLRAARRRSQSLVTCHCARRPEVEHETDERSCSVSVGTVHGHYVAMALAQWHGLRVHAPRRPCPWSSVSFRNVVSSVYAYRVEVEEWPLERDV
nr:unnamed protein product [Digitaria exilis]